MQVDSTILVMFGRCRERRQRHKHAVRFSRRSAVLAPALKPEAPAARKPFFFTIKLDPMNRLEDTASTNPFTLSSDAAIVRRAVLAPRRRSSLCPRHRCLSAWGFSGGKLSWRLRA